MFVMKFAMAGLLGMVAVSALAQAPSLRRCLDERRAGREVDPHIVNVRPHPGGCLSHGVAAEIAVEQGLAASRPGRQLQA